MVKVNTNQSSQKKSLDSYSCSGCVVKGKGEVLISMCTRWEGWWLKEVDGRRWW